MRNWITLTWAVALALAPAAAWAGPGHNEGPVDAGRLPGSAQTVAGSGPLTSISGETGGPLRLIDFQDMYRIQIDDPVAFSATTVGAAAFDTELWLFDLSGRGLLGNDDTPGAPASPQSTLSSPATDAGAQVIPGPGQYFLAISGHDDNPLSIGGQIFNQASQTEISSPDGPGGATKIVGWNDNGATGVYLIQLTGCSFISSIPTLSEWGLIVMTLLLLTAGIIIFARRSAPCPASR